MRIPLIVALLLAAGGAPAAEPTDAEIQGRQIVQQLLEQRATENYTNTGVLQIRGADGKTTKIPVRCEIQVTDMGWQTAYLAGGTNATARLYIIHTPGRANEYYYSTTQQEGPVKGNRPRGPQLTAGETMTAFAGSDFWIADLGLEFLQWPQQKLLKKEVKRSQGCCVLESSNPNPAANGYARVVSWIDSESGGIVQAFAYDAKGQLLKEFYPEDFQKVGRQWRVGTMEMDNDRTDSKTRLKFNLDDGSPKK
jgi:hypothetical protein